MIRVKYIGIRLFFVSLFFFILAAIIFFARGYRIDTETKKLTPTGIISVSSAPKAAKVYVNGVLKGASDINLTLPPGRYTVELKKEGYTDWKKTVNLKGEIVVSLDGTLFPRNPSLSPLTNLGIVKAIPIDQADKLLLFAQSNDVEKDGVYLFQSDKKALAALFPPLQRVVLKKLLSPTVDLSRTDVVFRPDYNQAMFTFYDTETSYSYLLDLNSENAELFPYNEQSKTNILASWDEERKQELDKIIETFPKDIRKTASESFQILAISPDDTKILYQATKPVTLPRIIVPSLIGANQTTEERFLETDKVYVYDKKEDKNFLIPVDVAKLKTQAKQAALSVTPSVKPANTNSIAPIITPTVTEPDVKTLITDYVKWYPSSRHLVIKESNEIDILEYDGTNKQTVYAGPFENNFFTLSPNWNLLILTNLNPQGNKSGDLYSVGIR